jgi:hypothetical protein
MAEVHKQISINPTESIILVVLNTINKWRVLLSTQENMIRTNILTKKSKITYPANKSNE